MQPQCGLMQEASQFNVSCVYVSLCQYGNLYIMTALGIKENVLTSNCSYSEVPLSSECSAWFPVALSLHWECPYIECPYVKCPYIECPYIECPHIERLLC